MIRIGSFMCSTKITIFEEDDYGARYEYEAPGPFVLTGIFLSWYGVGNIEYDNVAILLGNGPPAPWEAILSVNVPDRAVLEFGEFILNHNCEKELLVAVMKPMSDLASLAPLFEDTGRRVSYGYVKDQPVWRLIDYENRIERWRKE